MRPHRSSVHTPLRPVAPSAGSGQAARGPVAGVRAIALLAGIVATAAWSPGCSAPPPRLLVIGVDGATWKVMDPLLDDGLLPHVQALIDRGARGTIVATGDLKSPVIWTTVATGRNPSAHGIDDFLRGGVPVTSTMRRCPAVWNIVSEARPDLMVGVTGWYVTWPVEPIHGFMISDRLLQTRLEHRFYPRQLANQVSLESTWDPQDPAEADRLRRFTSAPFNPKRARLDASDPAAMESFLLDRRLARIYSRDATFARLAEKLEASWKPDLQMVYFRGVDYTSHGFWRDAYPDQFGDTDVRQPDPRLADVIPHYYEYIDEVIGRLVAAAGPDTTILVLSDHGFGAADARHSMGPEYWYLTGSHRPEGVVIAAGPGIRSGATFNHPSHLDVAPTILAFLGIPPGTEMAGRVWTEVLDSRAAARAAVERTRRYDEGWHWQSAPIATVEDPEVLAGLRALGYIPPAAGEEPPAQTPLFDNGFEGGDLSRWTDTKAGGGSPGS